MSGQVRGIAAGVLAFGVLAACMPPSVRYTPTNPPPHPLTPKPADRVAVFYAGPPPQPFVEVAVIEVQESSKYASNPDLVGLMRARAGQAGCDGLIVTPANVVTGGDGTVITWKGYRGACIVLLPMAPPPPPPAATAAAITHVCMPGITQPCTGPGGCKGGQRCSDDGRAWGVCDCGTGNPVSEP